MENNKCVYEISYLQWEDFSNNIKPIFSGIFTDVVNALNKLGEFLIERTYENFEVSDYEKLIYEIYQEYDKDLGYAVIKIESQNTLFAELYYVKIDTVMLDVIRG